MGMGARASAEATTDVVFGLLFLGITENDLGVVVFDEPAEVEKRGSVGDAGSLLHVVRDDDDGELFFQIEDEFLDFA